MSIFKLFKFDYLNSIQDAPLLSYEKEQLEKLNIDKIHFSGKYPTVFFKEVKKFDKETLKEIATIHHKLWNYKKVMFLYVTTLTEIRIYNCTNKPIAFDKDSKDIESIIKNHEIAQSKFEDKKKLKQLLEIFSASAIDSGSIWTQNNSYLEQIKLDERIDNFLVNSLINLAKKLAQDNISLDVIHALIMRTLFVMYLEDKEATPKEFYKDIDKEAQTFFDLLDNQENTYRFFKKIEENFNGNVFPVLEKENEQIKGVHLKLIKQCFINGDLDNESLFKDWRIFKFDIINIELLSQIYENFLNEIDKKDSGSYYTPPELVELILNEVLPINSKDYNIKILDPTCGSGIFLVEAYKRIVQRWQNAHPTEIITFKILKERMQNSIYGIEINENSIKVTTFSLYLAMMDFLYPATLWYQGDEKFPYLINDKEDDSLKEQGDNLFRTDTIQYNKEIEKEYDVIVGNPPYSKTNIPLHIKQYCKENNFSQEFVIPFIHKSALLSPNGKIALLAPTKLLTNTSSPAQNFRNWLFNKNYVEKIFNLSILRKAPRTFGGQLFSSAVVPASIYFFQSKEPKKISKTIEYWAPKTYIKSNLAEGVIIDSSDIKHLPRHECQKINTKIWKIAQWGKLNDFNLLNNISIKKTFLDYLNDKNIDDKGVGFQLIGESKTKFYKNDKIKEFGYLDAGEISRFHTPISLKSNISESIKSKKAIAFYTKYYNTSNDKLPQINLFRREGNVNTFKSNHVLIKEGFSDNLFCATFLDYECAFTSTVLGLKGNDNNILKLITCYLNSKFSTYFLFLTSSSWGIERERVKPNELYLLPYISENIDIQEVVQTYNDIKSEIVNQYPLCANISKYEKKLDELILNALGFSNNEQIFINDTINYSLDLFTKGHNSIAIKPLDNNHPESIDYAKKICDELNETLENSTLKVIPTIYKTSYYSPLCLVVIQFIDKNYQEINETNIIIDSEFNQILSKLNKYSISEYSKGIYVQKSLIYYDDDKIYITKPNQKRFWNLSSAIEDSQNITLEIMSMN